ncbi:MAG: hypothetical protein NC254_07625 [bacterium]|nr:hypothetical protein [bacterium]
MRIGAIAYQPYVYNTNTVSAASLNRINALPEDGTQGRTDFEGLTEREENQNPLERGQSANFMDILSSQMAMSRTKSAMLLKPAAASEDEDVMASAVQKDETAGRDAAQSVSDMTGGQNIQQKAADEALTIGDEESGATGASANETQDYVTSYKMRQALDAYSMTMGMVA